MARTFVEATSDDRSVRVQMRDGSWKVGKLHESFSVAEARSLTGRTLDLDLAYEQVLVAKGQELSVMQCVGSGWPRRWTSSFHFSGTAIWSFSQCVWVQQNSEEHTQNWSCLVWPSIVELLWWLPATCLTMWRRLGTRYGRAVSRTDRVGLFHQAHQEAAKAQCVPSFGCDLWPSRDFGRFGESCQQRAEGSPAAGDHWRFHGNWSYEWGRGHNSERASSIFWKSDLSLCTWGRLDRDQLVRKLANTWLQAWLKSVPGPRSFWFWLSRDCCELTWQQEASYLHWCRLGS